MTVEQKRQVCSGKRGRGREPNEHLGVSRCCIPWSLVVLRNYRFGVPWGPSGGATQPQFFSFVQRCIPGGGGGILYRVFSAGENSTRGIFRTCPKKSRGKFRTSQILSALQAKGNLRLRNFGRQRVAANIAFQCQRICRAYPQACALLLMRHQHTLAPLFKMIMPRKKPKRVLRWLTQAQFCMGKIPHLPSKKEGKIPHQVEIRNFPRGIPPPRDSARTACTTEIIVTATSSHQCHLRKPPKRKIAKAKEKKEETESRNSKRKDHNHTQPHARHSSQNTSASPLILQVSCPLAMVAGGLNAIFKIMGSPLEMPP